MIKIEVNNIDHIQSKVYKRMQEGDGKYASEARFLRKKQKEGGQDEEQEEEERQFKDNFEKAIKNHSQKQFTKDVQKQVEYFGYKIEPFNMREQEEMGEIDEDGFFVFNRRKRLRDAWMDSLNENEGQQRIDRLRKKIKQEQREKTVFQAEKKIEQSDKQDEQQQEEQQQEPDDQQNQIQQENKFQPKDIRLLLSELLPFNTSANQYLKKLKKQKNNQLYDKILLLCNEYIALTSQHDILTLKKQDLQQQYSEEPQPIRNWDKDVSEQEKPQPNIGQEQQDKDEDDIF